MKYSINFKSLLLNAKENVKKRKKKKKCWHFSKNEKTIVNGDNRRIIFLSVVSLLDIVASQRIVGNKTRNASSTTILFHTQAHAKLPVAAVIVFVPHSNMIFSNAFNLFRISFGSYANTFLHISLRCFSLVTTFDYPFVILSSSCFRF